MVLFVMQCFCSLTLKNLFVITHIWTFLISAVETNICLAVSGFWSIRVSTFHLTVYMKLKLIETNSKPLECAGPRSHGGDPIELYVAHRTVWMSANHLLRCANNGLRVRGQRFYGSAIWFGLVHMITRS